MKMTEIITRIRKVKNTPNFELPTSEGSIPLTLFSLLKEESLKEIV